MASSESIATEATCCCCHENSNNSSSGKNKPWLSHYYTMAAKGNMAEVKER
jgi:cytochrome c553